MILMLKKECFALYMFAMQNSSQQSFHLDFGIENQLKQIQSVHLYFCFFCFFFSLNVAFMTLFTSLFPCSFLQWFLDRMADDNWWPMQILIKCPNQIVRQVFSSFYFCYCTNKQMFNIPFCLINASVVFMIFFCFFSTCVFPDVPEVVYSCHTEAATGSRPSLPAAWNGRRVCPTRISILK